MSELTKQRHPEHRGQVMPPSFIQVMELKMSFAEQLVECRVLPVITARDIEATVRLAQALEQGGIRAVEITLRTADALAAISAVKAAAPQLVVGAGTVTTPQNMDHSLQAGADFCVPVEAKGVIAKAKAVTLNPLYAAEIDWDACL